MKPRFSNSTLWRRLIVAASVSLACSSNDAPPSGSGNGSNQDASSAPTEGGIDAPIDRAVSGACPLQGNFVGSADIKPVDNKCSAIPLGTTYQIAIAGMSITMGQKTVGWQATGTISEQCEVRLTAPGNDFTYKIDPATRTGTGKIVNQYAGGCMQDNDLTIALQPAP